MKPISIWHPEKIDGHLYFVRPPVLPLGDHYSDRLRIRAKKAEGVLRVCFFGESAAAGYLYTPFVTPAKVLQHQLNSLSGNVKFEVIDLSRTNERLDTMMKTIEASVQLKPDIHIIFSGNNWSLLETPEISSYSGSVEDRQQFAGQLKENGFLGPVEYAARKVLNKASSCFDQINTIAQRHAIKVVVAVPEVNLADWENIQPVTWLKDGRTTEWFELFERAKTSLGLDSWEGLLEQAATMAELDQWNCPTTYRLLGKALLGMGKEKEAEELFRAEIDATAYPAMGFLGAPQAGPRIQAFLRKAAEKYGFCLADLPRIFYEHTRTRIPGKRMFLDYCHLTLEGMTVAMAGIAEQLFLLSGNGEKSWENIAHEAGIPEISASQKAIAKFGAAIHNAHRLLMIKGKKELLQYWCTEAIKDDAAIKNTMAAYAKIRLGATPATLNKQQLANFHSAHRLQTQHGLQYDYIDAELLKVIEYLVGKRLVTVPLPLRLSNHPAYRLWEPLYQFYPNLMYNPGERKSAYFKCPWPETAFCFYADGDKPVTLSVIIRVPKTGVTSSRNITLEVNNKFEKHYDVNINWVSIVFSVPASQLKPGLNKLNIKWPAFEANGNNQLELILQRLNAGQTADLHPVFGEVFDIQENLPDQ